MQPPVPRGNKKKPDQPVIITTENKFIPKISERTIQKRQKAKDKQLNPLKYATGLDLFGILCLYAFLVLCVIIGAGGIGVCAYYLNDDTDTQGWKIAGIVFGIITFLIGIILILLTIFKQTRNRPWRYKKEETLVTSNEYYDNDQMGIENFDHDQIQNINIHQGSSDSRKNYAGIHSSSGEKTHEIATSPLPDSSNVPSNAKTTNNDLIFCPGCNRLHPSDHQCMYSTRIANSLAPFRSTLRARHQDSIAIQTEDNRKKKKIEGPHTTIDRSLKYSNTTETQTNMKANPRSNITESIILRRVPIPTAKVVVQQPTTKVMIVKVPNVAGQLIIQPKTEPTDE